MTDHFIHDARSRYAVANKATLAWMLDRPRRHGAFLDTKMNSITLADFPETDRWRGPLTTYGWIQGRGLESLVTHAEYFEKDDPAFAARLHDAARPLFVALRRLYDRYGAGFFAYNDDLRPVIRGDDGRLVPQVGGTGIVTYSDLFILKGLIRAAIRYEPSSAAPYLAKMADAVAAIEGGRFLMNEWLPLGDRALARQRREFGPRMIAMGAAAMLARLDLAEPAAFGGRFIDHILQHHLDPKTGLLRDAEGGDCANVGHAIEFAGFALEFLPEGADAKLIARLSAITSNAFNAGFAGPGLALHVSLPDARPASSHFPWWSLPEAIRAAALAYRRTGASDQLQIWRRADAAFFGYYWREGIGIAYQTRDAEGPVDYVPATSDLDPGYHTGLSLLGAIEVAER